MLKELDKICLSRLRNILKSKSCFYILLFIVIFVSVIRCFVIKRDSLYNGNEVDFLVTVKSIKKDLKDVIIVKGKEKLISYYENFSFSVGDTVKIKGSLSKINNNTIPNLFNYNRYLQSKGIYYELEISDIKLVKENNMWLGVSIHSGDREFMIPPTYEVRSKSLRVDEKGNRYIRVVGVRWFTNLDYPQRHEDLDLYKQYTPEEYPTYENYDAINVNKTGEIPIDFEGIMGVPITFMDKYNPDQFEILGMCENENLYALKTKVYTTAECKQAYFAKFGKNGTYDLNASGVILKDGIQEKVYQRILIRNKKPQKP